MSVKKRVTINLAVKDARSLLGYLRENFTPTSPERDASREKAMHKLELQLGQVKPVQARA